jgi:hypothetical protein
MPSDRASRMAAGLEERLVRSRRGEYMRAARHHGSKYSEQKLRELAAALLQAVLRGEIGPTSVTRLAQHFEVSAALVRAVLQQPDEMRRLNLLGESIVAIQAQELGRELALPGGSKSIVLVRTQPTCPIEGMHASYGGKFAFGLAPGRPSGAFDSVFATFASRANGSEESINIGGLVKALDKDREDFQAGNPFEYLSPLQRLSLTRPSAAMFAHAGAVDAAARPEIPVSVDASQYIFLQGRYEGYEPSEWLASPSGTVPIVSEAGYQMVARLSLGDEVEVIVDAEGSNPREAGLERRHRYVSPDGEVFSNEAIQQLMENSRPYRLDRNWLHAEYRGVGVILLSGELRATVPNAAPDAGQAILRMTADDNLRWFTLLNRSDGSRAWDVENEEKTRKLERLAEAFAMIEAGDSTAGYTRRQQFEALELFDAPMSNPSGRENVWRVASLARQSQLPEAPLGAVLLG